MKTPENVASFRFLCSCNLLPNNHVFSPGILHILHINDIDQNSLPHKLLLIHFVVSNKAACRIAHL